MDIKITPARLSGTLEAISSKSFAHRLLICAALADRQTRVELNCLSEDILATVRCLRAMGCHIEKEPGALIVEPIKSAPAQPVMLDCGESGSTARFLLPLAARLLGSFTMTGTGGLPGRPFAPLCDALAGAGCVFDGGALPLTGKGMLRPGDFRLDGGVSSQFVSGLLFALPLLEADSAIILTTPLQSAAYVDITLETLRLFGIDIQCRETGFYIRGNQRYRSPGRAEAEGDWSNAAFFLCMGALGGTITLKGLSSSSAQGDRVVMDILRRFGADTGDFTAASGTLRGIDIDASQIPDLIPALSVVASAAGGETRIYNAQRLRIKESDRLKTTCDMLFALGSDVALTPDGLLIRGKKRLRGGIANAAGDHRIAMAAATAACACDNPVIIRGCQAVNKSYPSFFEDYRAIGGAADVVVLGE